MLLLLLLLLLSLYLLCPTGDCCKENRPSVSDNSSGGLWLEMIGVEGSCWSSRDARASDACDTAIMSKNKWCGAVRCSRDRTVDFRFVSFRFVSLRCVTQDWSRLRRIRRIRRLYDTAQYIVRDYAMIGCWSPQNSKTIRRNNNNSDES